MAHPPSVEIEFGADHQVLRRALQAVVEVLPRDRSQAQCLLERLGRDLRRHMQAEEEALFASFERHTGLREEGPTLGLRRSHAQLGQRLDELAAAFAVPLEVEALARLLAQFTALLENHCSDEEAVLYPSCDRLLLPSELATASALLRQLKATREKP